ncbi:S-layer homology domain-containing protein [Paenibacillus sp. WLX2291]|uniref:S-layer homology domain-containing protein n=1 Tax=Paenibacillus sp. WLX2291 TaxID=3296934 RepID=UPI0039841E48
MKKSKLRSHQHRTFKRGACGWLVILLLLPSLPIHAEGIAHHGQVGQDTFLGGQYMELGISGSGTLGTSSNSPGGFHPGQLRQTIGLNIDSDGYDTGKDMSSGDYVLPGSPSEGFIVGYKPQPSSTSAKSFINEELNGNIEIPGTTQDISSDDQLAARTVGKTLDNALGVDQTISFKPGDSFYKTTITLTNTSVTDSVYDVHYMRFLDPDMDADLNSDNSTINWVPSNPPQDSDAIAVAMGNVSDNVFMYVASDKRAQASVGFSRDAYSEPAFRADGGQHTDAQLADDWLTLTFNAGDLEPGKSTELVFYSSVDPNMNAALSAIHADYQTAPEDLPTDIALSNDTLTWDSTAGTFVGQLSATSSNPDDAFIFSLVSGEGSEGNSYFDINNNRLEVSNTLVRGVNSYPIRVRVTGPEGGTFEKTFVIHATAPEQSAELTALSLQNGTLQPSFQPDVTSYTASMNADASNITVFASVYDHDATLSVNGVAVTDEVYGTGELQYTAPLTDDLTTLAMKVTAPNGRSKTYNVDIIPASLQAPSQQGTPATDDPATVPAPPVGESTPGTEPAPGSTPFPGTPVSDTYVPAEAPITITFPFLPQLPVDPTTSIPVIFDGGSGSDGAGASRLDDVVASGSGTSGSVTTPATTDTTKATNTSAKTSTAADNSAASKAAVVRKGYVQGYEDGTFRPDQQVTRAELAVMLQRLIGDNSDSTTANFKDVPASYWASNGIQLVETNGWMKGYPDGSFQPGQALTRAELASLISRWKGLDSSDTSAATPADVQSNWAASDINKVVSAGLMKGFPDGKFYPNQPVTRAEVVTVLNRIQSSSTSTSGTASSWKDVTPQHWAYDAINKASE